MVKQARELGIIRGVACTNRAYEIAPWCDYLVGADKNFWRQTPEALNFKGGKFAPMAVKGTIRFVPHDFIAGMNSGLYALCFLRELGAETIILLGYDLGGRHFHGDHYHGLKTPKDSDFDIYKVQFTKFTGCDILNATRESALGCFPTTTLERALNGTQRISTGN